MALADEYFDVSPSSTSKMLNEPAICDYKYPYENQSLSYSTTHI